MSCEDMKHYFPVVFFMKHEIFKKICPLYLMYTVNYIVCTTVVICFNLCSLAVGFSHYIFRKNTLSFWSCDSCRRLPEPKHHSFLFNH